MSVVVRRSSGCHHIWWMILGEDRTVGLICERCGGDDVEIFNTSVANRIVMQVGEITISDGRHDNPGPGRVPVHLYLRDSVSFGRSNGWEPEVGRTFDIVVSPREDRVSERWRRVQANLHRDDFDVDSARAIEPWRPRHDHDPT